MKFFQMLKEEEHTIKWVWMVLKKASSNNIDGLLIHLFKNDDFVFQVEEAEVLAVIFSRTSLVTMVVIRLLRFLEWVEVEADAGDKQRYLLFIIGIFPIYSMPQKSLMIESVKLQSN